MTTNYFLEMVAYFLATITMIVNTKYLHYIIYLIEKNFSDVLVGKSRTFSFYINAREATVRRVRLLRCSYSPLNQFLEKTRLICNLPPPPQGN